MIKKKIKTEDFIKSIIVTKKSSSNELEKIKNDRLTNSIEGTIEGLDEQQNKNIKSKNRAELVNRQDDSITNSQKANLTKSEAKAWEQFNKLLDAEFYRDKKDTFLMSLSGKCLSEFENIANGVTYKTGDKVSRNSVIRKVLEYYVHYEKSKLENIITKL